MGPQDTKIDSDSAWPLHADGLERRVLVSLLLRRSLLSLCNCGALVHGLARRALVVVGLASGSAALLNDVGLRGLQPLVAVWAHLHAVALSRDGVDGNRASAMAHLLHVVRVGLAAAAEVDLHDGASSAHLDLPELINLVRVALVEGDLAAHELVLRRPLADDDLLADRRLGP